MLGKHVVPTDVLPPSGAALDCCDQLHVPTPWYNCIVEVKGFSNLFVTKVSAVRKALESSDYEVEWVEAGEHGGYACLMRKTSGTYYSRLCAAFFSLLFSILCWPFLNVRFRTGHILH